MRQVTLISAGLALACALAASGDALAKARGRHPHHHGYAVEAHYYHGRHPLVLERRSFLDMGTAVPVGSEHAYMTQQTFFLENPVYLSNRNWDGGETLPHHIYNPWSPGFPIDY